MNKLKIGTCSWKYESWRGIVYPEFGDFNFLEEYSKQYNSVEIDQWFWSLHKNKAILPKSATVKDYADSVPDDFLFTIKLPNSLTLTHPYKSKEANPFFLSNDLMDSFLDSIDYMKDKIGMLMFQFEYLNKQKMNSLGEFISKLEPFFQNLNRKYSYGIEIRNPNYLNEPFFQFLKAHDISMVFLQGYFMPQITEVYKKAGNYLNNKAVIRFHGYDRKGIEEKTNEIWNSIVEPKDDELEKIIIMIKDLLNKEIDVFMNVNNHYEGSAPLTIEKINKMLKRDA